MHPIRSRPLLLGLLLLAACATTSVGGFEQYVDVPMSRVVPYPSEEDLAERSVDVVITKRSLEGQDASAIEPALGWTRVVLERYVREAGGHVIDRSLRADGVVAEETEIAEFDGESEETTGADFALLMRFSKYRYSYAWKDPFKWFWQSEDDVAEKAGTCNHFAEIALDIQVMQIGSNDRVGHTFGLAHEGTAKRSDLDSACPWSETNKTQLFERTLEEALECLELPLENRLAPKGYLVEHRRAPESERHVFRITLGRNQGVREGEEVQIFRVQHSTGPGGAQERRERRLASGTVTDRVDDESAWISVDVGDEPLLDGDLVRPVFDEDFVSSLSGPSCGSILTES